MTTNFVQRGCEFIKSAVEKDNEETYDEALALYSKGLQYLMTGLKYEKNQTVQAAIKKKVKKYLARAEEIKSVLEPKTKKRKKKKKRKYPTQQQINDANNTTNAKTLHLIHGFTRTIENILNIHYCIPDGIVNLFLIYYHIPITYTPDPKQHIAIVFNKPNVKWDDVVGLTNVKQKLKEYVILPLKFPALFTTKQSSHILLYGPPGAGKSLVSKAVATATNNATFFSISSYDLYSKYRGDDERIVRNIFAMARDKKPSIICFDEVDSICPVRDCSDYRRRVNTEFLIQLQNIYADSQIIVIGITNCPWDLSTAVRRRFTKRIYCGLPDQQARQNLFRINIGEARNNLSEQDYVSLAQRTEGFSGSDISGIVQDMLMEPVRNIQNATHFKRVCNEDSDYKWMSCNADDNGAIQMGLMDMAENEHEKIVVEPLEMTHFLVLLERWNFKASVSVDDIERYIAWKNEFEEEI